MMLHIEDSEQSSPTTIETFLVINEAGIPLFFQSFNPRYKDVDQILLAGFLQAIHTFSSTVIETNVNQGVITIDYGDKIITMTSLKSLKFVLIHSSQLDDKTKQGLQYLKELFIELFGSDATIIQANLDNDEKILKYRKEVISHLSSLHLHDTWVPYWLMDPPSNLSSEFVTLIDGKRSIKEIRDLNPLQDNQHNDVMQLLSFLWINGYLDFKNIFLPDDYLAKTNNYGKFINLVIDELQQSSMQLPQELITNIDSLLTGEIPFKTILKEIPEVLQEESIVFLEYLFKRSNRS